MVREATERFAKNLVRRMKACCWWREEITDSTRTRRSSEVT
jgi:hypothetical protein